MNTFKLYPKQDFSTSFVKLFRNLVRNCQGSKIGKKGNSNSVRIAQMIGPEAEGNSNNFEKYLLRG